MANLADVREALAVWFNLPVYMVDQLLARITPTVDLEHLVELAAERGGVAGPRSVWHSAMPPAAAGEFPRIQLMNPADSGIDIHIVGVSPVKPTTGICVLGFVNTALANAGVNRYMDQRIGISPDFVVKHPAGSLTYDSDAATGIAAADTMERTGRIAQQRDFIDLWGRLILPPGFGFRVIGETLNEVLRVTFYTREVPRRLA